MRIAALLSALLLVSFSSARAAPRIIHAGDDLQAALNAAQPGDELRLEAGATFRGSFVLPPKQGDGMITLTSDLPGASLLPDGRRISPADAARFAKIASPGHDAALRTAPRAAHWRIGYIEFQANTGSGGDIIELGDGSAAQDTLAQVPHDFLLDHLYVHGDPATGQKRGIALNAAAVTIRDCYVSDIKSVGEDAQAIAGWNGPGPFTIENNYLEAGAEVFLLGGADPAIPDLVPTDVEIRFNEMTRPMAWKGSRWQIKNIFELKNARRVTVEYNVFENNWVAAQPGYAILFTPRNQDGKCPWCVVESVTFAHNVVRNSAAGMNITGYDSPNPSAQTNNIRIEDNLFSGITTRLGGNGWPVLIGDAPRDVTFDRNTFDFDGTTLLYAYGGSRTEGRPIPGFRFTNNAGRHGQYGINGADASPGKLTTERYFPDATMSGNMLKDDLDVNAKRVAGAPGADVPRLLAMADAVAKGLRPPITSSAR
jgi:hypothetical protein